MKRIFTILFLSVSVFTANQSFGQEAPADSTANDGFFNLYAGIYNLSEKFNDPVVTRMALYHLLLSAPNKTGILDSLSLNYYNSQNWVSTILVTKENLLLNGDNELALELGAVSYEKLGLKDKALEQYELLFLKNDLTPTLYRVAFLQYELGRLKESLASTEILLNRADIAEQKLYFPKVDKTEMEVSMKSALLNLKGLISKAEGDITKAKEYYLEALKETPGFEIAQRNLSEADK